MSAPTENPDDNAWTQSVGGALTFLLARANAAALTAGHAALAPVGLKVRSYAVLGMVTADARPSQRDLAAFLRLDPSQVVALVDDLESRGLVRRQPDPTDRRTNAVVATPAGRKLYERARLLADEAEREVLTALQPAQRKQLMSLLRAIADS